MPVGPVDQRESFPRNGTPGRGRSTGTRVRLPTPDSPVVAPPAQDANTFLARLPLTASLLFAIASVLWVMLTDILVELLSSSPDQLAMVQTFKGIAFTLVSAALLYGLLRQATQRTLNQQARAQQNSERLGIALAATKSGVWEWHFPSRTFYLSAHLTDLTGTGRGAAYTWADVLERIHPDDRAQFGNVISQALQEPEQEHSAQYRVMREDGTTAWFEVRGRLLTDADGEPMRVAGVAIDISHTKEKDWRIERLTHFDSLTGLPNRAQFMRILEGRIEQRNGSDTFLLVVRLDISRFQDINNMMGARTGDEVLTIIGHRLEDVCGQTGLVSRFAGDDFALAVSSIDSLEAAQELAGALSQILHAPIELHGKTLSVSIVMGAAIAPSDGGDAETLIANAEMALVRARRDGAPLGFYEVGMNETFRERAFIEQELSAALRNGGLSLVYQPIVRADDQGLIGFEALSRWSHPKLGVVPPSTFIPLAESTGLIADLGSYVLRTACAQAASWNSALRRSLLVAVNVSARQMESDCFVDEVARVLAETGLAPECLELEVTESLIMEDPEAISGRLQRLRDLGVQVAIDDFGTGYSSLAVLKHLPVSKLKIDRSFVQDLNASQGGDAIVAAILELAHSMGLTVTAEGVETPKQLEFLRQRRCQTVQGYLIGRPLPPEALGAYINGSATSLPPR
ncbi:putative bifunctional diguanylate cyclase/phosphodiesterase [Pedomonas mirosovicensis]|uniref:putative bifunctional diguanylate cyclase/phosphodiesterase n=1 Tax=Pedomonas mirosovicensis TaxID=2908641 RepID=UPI0021686A3B|nr:GGDEF domain-containing phosphodiesterase [Pedomonas mirosovicensis]MCH8684226.1 EAL domain-containing protein [Pedomonas mirosovicensis]